MLGRFQRNPFRINIFISKKIDRTEENNVQKGWNNQIYAQNKFIYSFADSD